MGSCRFRPRQVTGVEDDQRFSMPLRISERIYQPSALWTLNQRHQTLFKGLCFHVQVAHSRRMVAVPRNCHEQYVNMDSLRQEEVRVCVKLCVVTDRRSAQSEFMHQTYTPSDGACAPIVGLCNENDGCGGWKQPERNPDQLQGSTAYVRASQLSGNAVTDLQRSASIHPRSDLMLTQYKFLLQGHIFNPTDAWSRQRFS